MARRSALYANLSSEFGSAVPKSGRPLQGKDNRASSPPEIPSLDVVTLNATLVEHKFAKEKPCETTANVGLVHDESRDPNGSAIALFFVLMGTCFGFCGAFIAWYSGLSLLPIIAVYSAVGCAGMLGSAVVFALLSSFEIDDD